MLAFKAREAASACRLFQTHTRAPQRKAAEPGSPHAVKSATAAWELRIFCLLQHVNALRGGGGARENPSSSPQPSSNGTLPSPRYPTKATHQGAHVHEPIQHGHRERARGGTQAAYLGRTKSTKEILRASLCGTSASRERRRARAASSPSLHLLG